MRILGIETSCDETSASIVEEGRILSNVVSSQIELHSPYGGVVPEIASRQHLRIIDEVIAEAARRAHVHPRDLDAIAVTRGPGLPSALLVGVAAARGLALRYRKPLVPIHHMEAHLYSTPFEAPPWIALIVSGGHTMLVHVPLKGNLELLGQTVDDAAGEAFDKAAQLMGLGYPGGPKIEQLAKQGNPRAYHFPRPMLDSGDFNFSFSGLKTALRRIALPLLKNGSVTAEPHIPNLAASFQAAILEVLIEKAIRAARSRNTNRIGVSGGVACNGKLRALLEERSSREGLHVCFADRTLCTDNAGMIALLAERKLKNDFSSPSSWDIEPDWLLAS